MSKRFSKIYVEITNYCNLNCSFCSVDSLPKKEMSLDEFKIVLDKIRDYTDSIYLHVKGEPLLHNNLDDILNLCDLYKIKVNITTNGTLLLRKKEILLKHEIRQINVSLHSENKMSDYFETVFNTCDELSKKTTIVYRIWTLPSLDLNKISTIIVEKIIHHYKLSTEIVDKIKKDKNIKIRDNIYLDKDYEFVWPNESEEISSDVGYCLGTKTHIAILSNGDIVPCCLDSSALIKLGNIFENNMNEIINSSEFTKISNGFKERKIINDVCKKCNYRKRFK